MNNPLCYLEDRQPHQSPPTRSRAWRRKTKFLNRGRDHHQANTLCKPEKNFKLLAQRPIKLTRAKQLGFEYPRISKQKQRLNAQHAYWNHHD